MLMMQVRSGLPKAGTCYCGDVSSRTSPPRGFCAVDQVNRLQSIGFNDTAASWLGPERAREFVPAHQKGCRAQKHLAQQEWGKEQ